MKKKSLLLIALISTGVIGFETSAIAKEKEKTPTSLEGNRLKNRKEYKDMKNLLVKITQDKESIAFHKAELKENRKTGKKIPAHISKKELRKAKADLKRDKKHLRINKQDLRSDQIVAYYEAKKSEFSTKKELRQAKRELKKDIRQNNTAEIDGDLKRIEALKAQAAKEGEFAEVVKDDAFEFFAYLDDEIDQVV